MAGVRTNSGKNLSREWNIPVRHALYHKDGTWYEPLERFPGALFDTEGFVLYPTRESFERCPHLSIGEKVNVPGGIASIPGYIKVKK